ncbi:transcriptional regulator [Kytococcus schroeteri]|uniref:Transcriptional regulator n=2 Tax=Kytococcus schroeteri TaxID=138300 RepID=A0A2I1PCI8_9MICO|nr:helix-turn-helix domain-containing protein [Kytococcus schroeteri]PKZ42347.1 transcriptional regulator [Kytococcus schroeteri]
MAPPHPPAGTGRADPRALAHPMRTRLVTELRLHGTATSADLARRLDTNTGVTSYHLRALEAAGFVTVEDGPGRRRFWSAVQDSWTPAGEPGDAGEADETEAALSTWLDHDLVDLFTRRAHTHIDTATEDPTWAAATGLQDATVLVSADQAVALRAELDAVLARYRRIGQGTPGAQRVVAWTALLPVD